jgi:HEAT repeat protein
VLEWVGAYLGRGLAEDLRALHNIRTLRRGTPLGRWLAAMGLEAAFPYCSSWLRSRIRKALAAATTDTDSAIRTFALVGLVRTGHETAAERLLAALRSDPDAAVRAASARVLRTCGDESAIPALHEAVRSDPEEQVRTGALAALCEFRAPDACDLAVERLQRGQRLERIAAANLLQALNAPNTIPTLQAALRVETDSLARRVIASALARLGEAGTQALVSVLADAGEFTDLRLSICLGLGLSDTLLAAEQLGRLLDDADRSVRHAVPWAATRIEGPGRREVIQRALQHPLPGVRREGLRALAERGRPDDSPLIEPMVADAWRSVREAAAEAMQSIRRRREQDAD